MFRRAQGTDGNEPLAIAAEDRLLCTGKSLRDGRPDALDEIMPLPASMLLWTGVKFSASTEVIVDEQGRVGVGEVGEVDVAGKFLRSGVS